MLRQLNIRDFVLVDQLELEFSSGFGALTGETGAGKSILLDALSLVLGERADSSVVRSGCERAEITAQFDLEENSPVLAWLAQQEIALEENALLLRRIIDAGGRSRAYINAAMATAAQLREVGELLADIHGQHAHHALLRPAMQRAVLDTHANLNDLVLTVAELYREWEHTRQLREQAEQGREQAEREREMLSWQARELRELDFVVNEWEGLNQEHARLAHAASLMEGCAVVAQALSEGEQPLVAETTRLGVRLNELASYDADLKPVAVMLDEASISLQEAAYALRRYRERLDLDPERLAALEARIAAVHQVARKYRTALETLPQLLEETEVRLQMLEAQSDLAALIRTEKEAREKYFSLAQQLSGLRQKAAVALSKAITEAMQDLALAGGSLTIDLQPEPAGSAQGLERIEFLVAANPNQEQRPLAKVASGGELSRIGLAIQVIVSEAQAVPTLIFDEVDVGIGGRVAEIVGRRLKTLGLKRQVLCVTHLPQVAAQADWQWRISKEIRGKDTVSRVKVLDTHARVEEIARMLGGETITETTRTHAAEMLGSE